jgi:hypothetical protein
MSRGTSAIMSSKAARAAKAAGKLKDLEKAEAVAKKSLEKAAKAYQKAVSRVDAAKAKAAA